MLLNVQFTFDQHTVFSQYFHLLLFVYIFVLPHTLYVPIVHNITYVSQRQAFIYKACLAGMNKTKTSVVEYRTCNYIICDTLTEYEEPFTIGT